MDWGDNINVIRKHFIVALTPPSRIRNGSISHSSLTASSSAWNHLSSRFPSHQSAVRSMLTYIEVSLINDPNVLQRIKDRLPSARSETASA